MKKDRKSQLLQDEDALLDELEAVTSRMKDTSQNLNAGTVRSTELIESIHNAAATASTGMQNEGRRAMQTRGHQNSSGFCKIYMIILAELLFLVYLLYIGLGNM